MNCECGCGLPAPLSEKTDRKYGWVKGQPKRFLVGHNNRGRVMFRPRNGRVIIRDGYVGVLTSPGQFYRPEHVVLAERALGRPLVSPMQVHHVDENKANNGPGNLVICHDTAYHRLLHARTRAYQATGSAHARKCAYCKEWYLPSNPDSLPGSRHAYHKSCKAKYEGQRQARYDKQPKGLGK